MKEIIEDRGPVRFYTPEEARKKFAPQRDRIFDTTDGVSRYSKRVFNDDSWAKVIIRGSLVDSARTDISCEPPKGDEELLEWAIDDPRSELQPLLDLLVEDGIGEVVHMYPGCTNPDNDAVTTRPTYRAIRSTYHETYATRLQERPSP